MLASPWFQYPAHHCINTHTQIIGRLLFYFRLLAGFICALLGAVVALFIHLPIPWMLGPLLMIVILKSFGAPLTCNSNFRKVGQWIIGISLGLHFTPEVLTVLKNNLVYIISGSVFSVALGVSGAYLMKKMNRVDFESAFFASTIGGASEMTNLAERNNADTELAAATHSVRILVVFFLIPFVYQTLDLHGNFEFHEDVTFISLPGIGKQLLIVLPLIMVMQYFKLPNPWLLGSLITTAVMVGLGVEVSHLYDGMLNFAQLLLAWYLGCNFKSGFFKRSYRIMAGQLVIVFYYMLAGLLFAYVLHLLSDMPTPSLFLGLSPGGVAEMSVTAKVLDLGVAIVAAFQVFRLIAVLLTAEPLYKFLLKRRENKQPGNH